MPDELKQGYKDVGWVDNSSRLNQRSLFGERKNKNYWDRSLAERWLNGLTDALHLTSPPTTKDGYGTVRPAEVPLSESAQGQELGRLGKTLGGVGLAVGLAADPVSTITAMGTGALGMYGSNKALNWMDRYLNKNNMQIDPRLRNTVNLVSGAIAGGAGAYATAKVPVNFNDRSMGFASLDSEVYKALSKSDYQPRRVELWADKLEHALLKAQKRRNAKLKVYDVGPEIGKGSESNVYTNNYDPSTVVKVQYRGVVVPKDYAGPVWSPNPTIADNTAKTLAGMKNKGAYTLDQFPTVSHERRVGEYYPTFIQEKVVPVKSKKSFSPRDIRALTRLMMNSKPYADAHLGNVGFDYSGTPWLIDAPLKSEVGTSYFNTSGNWMPRSKFNTDFLHPSSSSTPSSTIPQPMQQPGIQAAPGVFWSASKFNSFLKQFIKNNPL